MPRFTSCIVALALLLAGAGGARGAETATRSALDAQLFYQLLLGELELRSGRAGTAFEAVLDAARRTRNEALFRRAVEIALSARAGDQALTAANAWRAASGSAEAQQTAAQLLIALNRPAEAVEPIQALLALPPESERSARIAALPRMLARSSDRARVVALLEPVLKPYLDAPETRTAAGVALGRLVLAAGDKARALEFVQQAHAAEPSAEGPALLALEMMPGTGAEAIVAGYLATPSAQAPIRLVYVRVLTAAQRYTDALAQLDVATRADPELASAWLNMGALYLELRQPADAERALKRYLEVAAGGGDTEDDDQDPNTPPPGITQALLMLAQVAEMRADYAGAEGWLSRIDSPRRALDVQLRRASLLARQGQVARARELLRATPERTPEDARSKLIAEAQLLRDVKQWREAHDVLGLALARHPDDPDLMYEQAMVAEKLNRLGEMEKILRRVIELKPDHHHAYNALGYSLADRNLRLSEARELIRKALELAPGDPFITDSLGWVEYRLGNRDEALRLLREAYNARPDVEIAAHLGEVLWAGGQRDEARRIWRDAHARDASNEVLRETLARLRVGL